MKQYIIFIILSFISGIITSQMINGYLIALFGLWSFVFGIFSIGKLIANE